MKNTLPETTQSVARQPETAPRHGGALSNLSHSVVARLATRSAVLLAVLTPAIATGCGEGADEEGKPLPPSSVEIPECQQPENLDAPAPCVEPLEYLLEGKRLTVNIDVPEYDEFCLNPLKITVLGDTWTDKGDGTTDLNPMQELEGVKWVNENDGNPKTPDDFITAEVPPGSDLTGFAILTEDARGEQCVSDSVATSTAPLTNPGSKPL